MTTHEYNTQRIAKLEAALLEIVRRSQMLVYQNSGRWDMTVEHDARSQGVTEGNIKLAEDALKA